MYVNPSGHTYYEYPEDIEVFKEDFPVGTLVTNIYPHIHRTGTVVGHVPMTMGYREGCESSLYPDNWCLLIIEYHDKATHPTTIFNGFVEYFHPLRMDWEVDYDNEG